MSGEPGPPRPLAALLDPWPATPPPLGAAGAAVLIVLRERDRDIEALLIQRAERPGDPASGQVALPGGRVAPSDPDLLSTALRESEEEVGLGSADLAGTPRFVSVVAAPVFSMSVGVFAAALSATARPPSARSTTEVARVFWLPSRFLRSHARVTRDTPLGPRQVDAVVHEGHVLWGFTRRVLRAFFGLEPFPGPDGALPEIVPPSVAGAPGGGPPHKDF